MNLIFSEEDYHRVYRDAYCGSNITHLNAFRDSTYLFISYSPTDPNLCRLLDVASRQGETPRHFANMKRNNIATGQSDIEQDIIDIYKGIDARIHESYFRSIGLNIIWTDRFEEITNILKAIKIKVSTAVLIGIKSNNRLIFSKFCKITRAKSNVSEKLIFKKTLNKMFSVFCCAFQINLKSTLQKASGF